MKYKWTITSSIIPVFVDILDYLRGEPSETGYAIVIFLHSIKRATSCILMTVFDSSTSHSFCFQCYLK